MVPFAGRVCLRYMVNLYLVGCDKIWAEIPHSEAAGISGLLPRENRVTETRLSEATLMKYLPSVDARRNGIEGVRAEGRRTARKTLLEHGAISGVDRAMTRPFRP